MVVCMIISHCINNVTTLFNENQHSTGGTVPAHSPLSTTFLTYGKVCHKSNKFKGLNTIT